MANMHYVDAVAMGYGQPYAIVLNGRQINGTMFEAVRIIPSTVPEGMFTYGTRHFDDDWSIPASISLGYPWVNFFGTFITTEDITLEEETDLDDCWLVQ